MGSDLMSTSSPRKCFPITHNTSSRRLIFEDIISNDTISHDFHEEKNVEEHSQKLVVLNFDDEFAKQSDQETEESNSCLKSTSDGKISHGKGLMEIEHDSIFFHNVPCLERLNSSRSPSPRKKANNSTFAVNMKVLEKELLNTPTKRPIIYTDDVKTSYSAYISKTKRLQEGIPRLNSDFQIIEVIGKGSFGKVYRCRHKLDQNEYAVKETLKKFVGRHRVYGLNEIQALASLTAIEENTNVVRYYHSWVEDEKLYLVMEYCPKSLKEEMIEKGQFTEVELKKILRDICVGLSYLHRNDIVHLDIKPENILISKTKKYKLGDMGQSALAKLSFEEIEEGDARYLAPELLNSEEYSEKPELTKADVFSLGITLFELATRHSLPINGSEWHAFRNEKLELLDNVSYLSEPFKKLVKLMLKRDPKERPSFQELLTHYLPDQLELELRWEKVQRNVLKNTKEILERKVEECKNKQKQRSKSVN